MFAALALFLGALTLSPSIRLLAEGIAPGGHLDLGPAAEILGQRSTWRATVRTLEVSIGGTALAIVLGGLFAALVALTDLRAKASLVFCFMLPMMIPPQVTALSWIQLFGPSSAILQAVGLAPPLGTAHPLYSAEGIILLLGIQHAPLVFLAVRAGLRSLPKEMIEAARAAGASGLSVFRTIVVPLMIPPLVSGAALAFVSCVGNFGIQAMLGIPARYSTLITLIYQRLSNFGPTIISDVAILSIIVGLIAGSGLALQWWLLRRRDYRTIGAPSQPLHYDLGRWRLPVEAACWLLIGLILVLPASALLFTSLVPGYGMPLTAETATLQNYIQAVAHHAATARGFANSLILASTVSVLLTLIAVPLAYMLVWRRRRSASVLNAAAEMTYAMPGVVIGIAAILLFLKPLPLVGFSLYGTVWIIFAAYMMNYPAIALRPVIGGFLQLDRSLEEAAQMSGARFMMRLRTIVIPLIAPVAAAGAILVFLTAFNEIQISLLLVSMGSETIGAVVYFLEESGTTTMASAVSILVILAVIALTALISALSRWLPRGVLPWEA